MVLPRHPPARQNRRERHGEYEDGTADERADQFFGNKIAIECHPRFGRFLHAVEQQERERRADVGEDERVDERSNVFAANRKATFV